MDKICQVTWWFPQFIINFCESFVQYPRKSARCSKKIFQHSENIANNRFFRYALLLALVELPRMTCLWLHAFQIWEMLSLYWFHQFLHYISDIEVTFLLHLILCGKEHHQT